MYCWRFNRRHETILSPRAIPFHLPKRSIPRVTKSITIPHSCFWLMLNQNETDEFVFSFHNIQIPRWSTALIPNRAPTSCVSRRAIILGIYASPLSSIVFPHFGFGQSIFLPSHSNDSGNYFLHVSSSYIGSTSIVISIIQLSQ